MKPYPDLFRIKAAIRDGSYLNPTTQEALDRTQVIVDRIIDDLEGRTDRHDPNERGSNDQIPS